MNPVRLEVIAPTLQGLSLCNTCDLVLAEASVGQHPTQHALDEYPQDWQDDVHRLTDWVYDLASSYGDSILIKVIDPQSPEGLLRSLRYRVRRYPTWIVNCRIRVVGWDRPALDAALQQP